MQFLATIIYLADLIKQISNQKGKKEKYFKILGEKEKFTQLLEFKNAKKLNEVFECFNVNSIKI